MTSIASRPITPLPQPTTTRMNPRTRMFLILAVQVVGACSVLISWCFYTGGRLQFDWPIVVAFSLALIGAGVFAGSAALRFFAGLPIRRWLRLDMDYNPIEVEDAVIRWCRHLIFLDALLCGVLIGVTGGFVRSFYVPLASSLYTMAIALRFPRRDLANIVVVTTVLITVGLTASPHLWVSSYQHVEDGAYAPATVVNLVVATLVTIAAGFESFLVNLPRAEIALAFSRLQDFIEVNPDAARKEIEQALTRYAADVGRSGLTCDLSVVHTILAPVEQGLILAIPHLEQKRNLIGPTSYVTFVSHWFDDFFDNVLTDFHVARFDDMESLDSVINENHVLSRLYARMCRRMGGKRYWFRPGSWVDVDRFHCLEFRYFRSDVVPRGEMESAGDAVNPRTFEEIARRALRRVLLGALIYRSDQRHAVETLIRTYREVMRSARWVSPDVLQMYDSLANDETKWCLLWGTGKCVLDLFESCAEAFDPDCSELYSVLYGPFLIAQDIDQELLYEKSGKAFREKIFTPNGKLTSRQMGFALDLFERNRNILNKEDAQVRVRRGRQIEALLALYGEKMEDDLKSRYHHAAETLTKAVAPRVAAV